MVEGEGEGEEATAVGEFARYYHAQAASGCCRTKRFTYTVDIITMSRPELVAPPEIVSSCPLALLRGTDDNTVLWRH